VKPYKIERRDDGWAGVQDRATGMWVGWIARSSRPTGWEAYSRGGDWIDDRCTRVEAAELVYQTHIERSKT